MISAVWSGQGTVIDEFGTMMIKKGKPEEIWRNICSNWT
jgi:hypothetical protein